MTKSIDDTTISPPYFIGYTTIHYSSVAYNCQYKNHPWGVIYGNFVRNNTPGVIKKGGRFKMQAL